MTPFEVIVGAILTQNTDWRNVEKALNNLNKESLLVPHKLKTINTKSLAELIRPSGYFNIKAKRLKEFIKFLFEDYRGSLGNMKDEPLFTLRDNLLSVHGIGKETADSILLYAFNRPIFVVDAYTKRILERLCIINERASYDDIQKLFMEHLPHDARLFNEFHALLVRLGKELCTKHNPRCGICPLKNEDDCI